MLTRQLIVGMPASGKSSYIAALRHLLLAGEVPASLELTGLAQDEAHLNRLENDWLECKTLERTKPATEGWVELHVRDRVSGQQTTLSIPDLRGEAFEQPACLGECQADLFDALEEATGLMLFTNADRQDDALLIDEFADILDGEVDVSQVHTQRFVPEMMPEEVKIVEFLQVANRRPNRPRQRNLSVLVSAWDLVEGEEGVDPALWLRNHRPMLSQFLTYNSELWNFRVYGVSALGGALPKDKDVLAKIRQPSKRIKIVGHGASTHDISAPLQWLINGAES